MFTTFFYLVRCIRGKASHFAKELYKSMKGLGTDDDRLCRVIVSRCEVDMVQIKEEFQKQYKQTLAMFIAVSISQQLTDNAVWMHFSLYLPLYCLYSLKHAYFDLWF